MVLNILWTCLAAALFTEVIGYFIHILLHGQRVEFLSRNHMIHHLKVYQPKGSLRDVDYHGSTEGRYAVNGIGVEWLAPGALIAGAFLLFAQVLGMPGTLQVVFIAASCAWGRVIFGTMHDAMHVKDFWMLNNRFTRKWFLEVRRLHDIHHMDIDNGGKMTKNFGITTFFMDKIFGSIAHKARPFNEKGYAAAKTLYSFIY